MEELKGPRLQGCQNCISTNLMILKACNLLEMHLLCHKQHHSHWLVLANWNSSPWLKQGKNIVWQGCMKCCMCTKGQFSKLVKGFWTQTSRHRTRAFCMEREFSEATEHSIRCHTSARIVALMEKMYWNCHWHNMHRLLWSDRTLFQCTYSKRRW